MAEISRRQMLGLSGAFLLRPPPFDRPRFRPEYERTLSRALICFPGVAGDSDPALLVRFLEAAFDDLAKTLPTYTKVDLVTRQKPTATLEGARLHVPDDPEIEIELWAQDLGEMIEIGGGERFLVSSPLPPSMGPASKMAADRKRVAELVFGRDSVVEAPFAFEGGNLSFDSGRVLMGRNAVSRTIAASRQSRSRQQVLDDMAAAFGGVEVIEMGKEPQTPFLQHIDQAFVLLDGRVAVVCRLETGVLENEARQLRRYAGQLRELGYRVVFLDHQASDLERYRSSINVVPFFDREAGRKRVLLPVFPGELKEGATGVDRNALVGKAARAFDLYRDLGYEPSPLRDVTHPLGGNTHCILNVLS